MERKLKLLLILLPLFCMPLFASSLFIGFEGGYDYSIVNSRTGWSNTYMNNSHGFDITVPVEYKIRPWVSVNTGLRFMMRALDYEKYASLLYESPYLIAEYKNMYYALDFPITARFAFGNETYRAFIGAGAYIGVRLFDVITGRSFDYYINNYAYSGETRSLQSWENYFDAGLIAEAGLSIAQEDIGYLYLLFRYQYGLTSLSRDYMQAHHTYFDNISISMGYMFNI